MRTREKIVECDHCGEAFVGERAIESYTRAHEWIMENGEWVLEVICLRCLEDQPKRGYAWLS